MKSLSVLFLFALLFVVSCTQVPLQKGYPLSYQQEMQASEHWNDLASRVAEKVQPAISSAKIQDRIFITDADGSPFGKAMRSFLKSQLEKRGIGATEDRNSPYVLTWEVQRVFFPSDGSSQSFSFPLGILTSLRSLFVDGVYSGGYVPHSEVIVSFELKGSQKGSLMPRETYVFYVNDEDRMNYIDIPSRNWDIPQKALESKNYIITSN